MGFSDIFSELNHAVSAGVLETYAVGGAVGATFYIEAVETEDLDVFVHLAAPSGKLLLSLEPVYEHFRARGAAVEGEHLLIAGWPVQFLPSSSPLEVEALERAVLFEVDGVSVRVLSAEYLAAIALDLGRPKDKIRLQSFLAWSKFSHEAFADLLSRHNLSARYAEYRRTFLSELK